jgi:hypothetical protein
MNAPDNRLQRALGSYLGVCPAQIMEALRAHDVLPARS